MGKRARQRAGRACSSALEHAASVEAFVGGRKVAGSPPTHLTQPREQRTRRWPLPATCTRAALSFSTGIDSHPSRFFVEYTSGPGDGSVAPSQPPAPRGPPPPPRPPAAPARNQARQGTMGSLDGEQTRCRQASTTVQGPLDDQDAVQGQFWSRVGSCVLDGFIGRWTAERTPSTSGDVSSQPSRTAAAATTVYHDIRRARIEGWRLAYGRLNFAF